MLPPGIELPMVILEKVPFSVCIGSLSMLPKEKEAEKPVMVMSAHSLVVFARPKLMRP